jgi:hypothetical protein
MRLPLHGTLFLVFQVLLACYWIYKQKKLKLELALSMCCRLTLALAANWRHPVLYSCHNWPSFVPFAAGLNCSLLGPHAFQPAHTSLNGSTFWLFFPSRFLYFCFLNTLPQLYGIYNIMVIVYCHVYGATVDGVSDWILDLLTIYTLTTRNYKQLQRHR